MTCDREWKRYRRWIIKEKLRLGSMEKKYSRLFDLLSYVDFVWDTLRFPLDENRAVDGLILREEYEENWGEKGDYNGACSVLEMLAAFAIRIDLEYTGNYFNPDPGGIFIEMLGNLGLLSYENGCFDEVDVHQILHFWMHRRCEKSCEILLFPLKRLKVDQLGQELWDQMLAYLTENY